MSFITVAVQDAIYILDQQLFAEKLDYFALLRYCLLIFH